MRKNILCLGGFPQEGFSQKTFLQLFVLPHPFQPHPLFVMDNQHCRLLVNTAGHARGSCVPRRILCGGRKCPLPLWWLWAWCRGCAFRLCRCADLTCLLCCSVGYGALSIAIHPSLLYALMASCCCRLLRAQLVCCLPVGLVYVATCPLGASCCRLPCITLFNHSAFWSQDEQFRLFAPMQFAFPSLFCGNNLWRAFTQSRPVSTVSKHLQEFNSRLQLARIRILVAKRTGGCVLCM